MRTRKKIMSLAVLAGLGAGSNQAFAAGFQLIEQNASGLGNAYAGQAAAAEDASTLFFNPAGMAYLPGKQGVVAGHIIIPSAKFSNTASTAAAGGFALGPNGGDAGDAAFVPNLYFTWTLDPKWSVGVGVNAPFGLKTDYDSNWVGRFHALKSEVKSYNVNPSIAFKANDNVSIGFGLNWQRVEAELTKAVNYTAVGAGAGIGVAPATEGSNKITGNDNVWGFNLGAIFKAGPNTNIGLAYRSSMKYTLSGSAAFFGRPAALQAALGAPALAAQIGDSPITADIKLPASFSFAVKHQINSKWDVLADATRTQWSSIQALNIVRNTGFVLESVPFNWRNTWRVGLGFNYRPNQPWTVRFGVAYDQTPTSDTFRIPRIPDQDRTWLAIGAQYKVSQAGAIDFGYAHLFVKNPTLNMNGPPSLTPALLAGRGALIGNYSSKVDILSVQYRHNF